MMLNLAELWRRITGSRRSAILAPIAVPVGVRLHLPRSLRLALTQTTSPRAGHPEPLALLLVRYAGEGRKNVLVGVGVRPFPEEAYVECDAGANFDTRWLVARSNEELATNVGVMLVHSHGGRGVPEFSPTDRRANRDVIAKLAIGVDTAPYGALLLSSNSELAVVAAEGSLVTASVIIVPDASGRLDVPA